MSFDTLNVIGQQFAEDNMGEAFSYTSTLSVVTSGLVGVFNQVVADYQFSDFSTRKVTTYTVVSGKSQWGAVIPGDRGIITDSSGGTYQIENVAGSLSAGEPAYELTLKKLT